MSSTALDGSGAMFDGIARRYDLLNRITSLGLDHSWRRATARAMRLVPGTQVLDLATGTGDLAIAIAKREPTAHVVGLDASPRMLELAAPKLSRAHVADRVELREGDAEHLPFPDASFDRVSMAFGIRNMPDRAQAIRELARVLRPRGIAAILELSKPERGLLAPFARLYIERFVPWIGAKLSGEREYRHLERSIAAFPQPERFADELRAAGLTVTTIRPLTFGACVLFLGEKP